MSDNIIPALQKILLEDTTIGPACDYKVEVADDITLADSKLQATQQTCIFLHELNINREPATLGYATNKEVEYDILFEINVLSKQSEAYARALEKLVCEKIIEGLDQAFGSDFLWLNSPTTSTHSMYDDGGKFWRKAITVRGTGFYTI